LVTAKGQQHGRGPTGEVVVAWQVNPSQGGLAHVVIFDVVAETYRVEWGGDVVHAQVEHVGEGRVDTVTWVPNQRLLGLRLAHAFKTK
jgi:hypothetical protein